MVYFYWGFLMWNIINSVTAYKLNYAFHKICVSWFHFQGTLLSVVGLCKSKCITENQLILFELLYLL